MSDRVGGFTVTLKEDLREDDAEFVAQAIRQLRGVAEVAMIVSDSQAYVVRVQERVRLHRAILDVFTDKGDSGA